MLYPPRQFDKTDFYALGKLKCHYCSRTLKASVMKPYATKQGELHEGLSAYICPNHLCHFGGVNDLTDLHSQLEKYIIIRGKVIGDQNLYKRWLATSLEERTSEFKRIFRGTNFLVAESTIEVPPWAEE